MADSSGDTQEGFKTPKADSPNLTEGLEQDNQSTESKVDPIMLTSRNYYDQQLSTSPWSLPEGSNSGDSNPDLIPGRRRHCNHQMTSSWTPVEDVDGHDSFSCDKCAPSKKREPKLQLGKTSACSIPNEPPSCNIHVEEKSSLITSPVASAGKCHFDQPRSTSPWSHAEGSHSGDSNPDLIPGRRRHCNHQMTSSWTPVEDVDGHDSFCCDKCAPRMKRERKLQFTTASDCSIPNEPPSSQMDFEEKSSLEPAGHATQDANVIGSGERRHYEQAD